MTTFPGSSRPNKGALIGVDIFNPLATVVDDQGIERWPMDRDGIRKGERQLSQSQRAVTGSCSEVARFHHK